MRFPRTASIGLLSIALSALSALAQTFPPTIPVQIENLAFVVAPLSVKGTVADQVTTGLRAIKKQTGGSRIVRLRAFVTSSDDAAKVPSAVARGIGAKSLPVLNVIRIGALAESAAKVVLEATLTGSKAANPEGLVFVSGQLTTAPKDAANPDASIADLEQRSLTALDTALGAAGTTPSAVVRITCFASTLTDHASLRGMAAAKFPNAALDFVRIQRNAANREIECEAVARLSKRPPSPIQLTNPTGAAFAQSVLVAPGSILLTSTFGSPTSDDAGMRESIRSMGEALDKAGASLGSVFYLYGYPGTDALLQRYRDVRWEFFDRMRAPASTNLVFEGVGESSAFGMDAMALPLSRR